MDQQYYTCNELMERHIKTKILHWNTSKIGVFYNCLLLDGKAFGKHGRVMIFEPSFKELIEYAYSCIVKTEQKPEFLCYDEVLSEYPLTRKFRWTLTGIGFFRHSNLLKGKYSNKECSNMVTRESVKDLLHYTSSRFIDIQNI